MIHTNKDKDLLAHMVANGQIKEWKYSERGTLAKLVCTFTKKRTAYEMCGVRRAW